MINKKYIPFAIAGIHFLLGLIVASYHEMWRDELQIWLNCADSHSISELLVNKEADHPILWYLVVMIIQLFADSPFYMQIFDVLMMSGSVFLIWKYAPFDTMIKFLSSFGYYLFYEYSVIARNYSGAIFFMFVALVLIKDWKKNIYWLSLCLVLMSNFHTNGGILAGCIIVYLFLNYFEDKKNISLKRILISISIIGVGMFLSVFEVLRRSISWGYFEPKSVNGIQNYLSKEWVYNSVYTFFYGFITLPNFNDPYVWNSSVLQMFSFKLKIIVGLLISVSIILIVLYSLRKDRKSLLVYLIGSGLFIVVFSFIKYGQLRNHAFLFLTFFMCSWLYFYQEKSKLISFILKLSFTLQFITGITMVYAEVNKPFSNAKDTAIFINENELTKYKIIGSRDFAMVPISYYMNSDICYTESNSCRTYLDWGERKFILSLPEIIDYTIKELKNRKKPIVLIINKGDFDSIENIILSKETRTFVDNHFSLIYENEGAIVCSENYWIYLLKP